MTSGGKSMRKSGIFAMIIIGLACAKPIPAFAIDKAVEVCLNNTSSEKFIVYAEVDKSEPINGVFVQSNKCRKTGVILNTTEHNLIFRFIHASPRSAVGLGKQMKFGPSCQLYQFKEGAHSEFPLEHWNSTPIPLEQALKFTFNVIQLKNGDFQLQCPSLTKGDTNAKN